MRVIRDDGKIAGADPTLATCTGTIKLRFDGATLMADAAGGDPVALSYALTMAEGWSLTFDLFRVFLPKPKYTISGRDASQLAGSRPASTGAPPTTKEARQCCVLGCLTTWRATRDRRAGSCYV